MQLRGAAVVLLFQTTSPVVEDGPRLRVFVSYARRDLNFAKRLVAALETRGIDVLIDERDLPLAVEFQQELLGFIRQADSIVFVVSPASISSSWCAWEVEQVGLLNKRLAPVVLETVPDDRVPASIRKINYVYFTGRWAEGAGFEQQSDALARALKTDVPWIKEHTRLGELARRWAEGGSGRGRLLWGDELKLAESWSSRQPLDAPPLTELHRKFILSSRAQERWRQRSLAGGSLALAIVGFALAGFAFWQKQVADDNATLADTNAKLAIQREGEAKQNADTAKQNEARAVAEQRRAAIERDAARRNESALLADESLRDITAGAPRTGMLRALKALPATNVDPDRPYLPRAEFALARAALADREIFTLIPGQDRANYAAYSGDGKYIASGSRDGQVKIWDAASGKPVRSFYDDRKAVYGLGFSPDGSHLAVSYETPPSIVVRDVVSGNVVADFNTGRLSHNNLVFWPDNSRLASSVFSFDSKPRIWDLKSRSLLATLQQPTSWDNQVSQPILSPDLKLLVQAGSNSTFVWDAQNFQPVIEDLAASINGIDKDDQVASTRFRSDSGHLIAKGKTKIYDVDCVTKAMVKSWPYNGAWAAGARNLLEISNDNRTVALLVSDREPVLFDLADGSNRRVLAGHTAPLSAMAFSPAGGQIATASEDGSVLVFETATGQLLFALRDQRGTPRGISYAPDGSRLIAWDDRAVHVYDVRPDLERLSYAGPGPLWTLQLVDGKTSRALFKPAGDDAKFRTRKLVLWDLVNDRPFATIEAPSGETFDVDSGQFSKNSKLLAIATNGLNGGVIVFGADTGATEGQLVGPTMPHGYTLKYAMSDDASVIVLGRSGSSGQSREVASKVVAWDRVERKQVLAIESTTELEQLFLSPDGKKLAVIVRAPDEKYSVFDISLWDIASATKLMQVRRSMDHVNVRFITGSARLFIFGGTTAPLVYDTASGRQVGKFGGQQLSAKSFWSSKDGSRMVVTRENGPLSIWDSETGQAIATLPGPNKRVSWVKPSRDGARVLSHNYDYVDKVQIHLDVANFLTGQQVRRLGPFQSIEAAEIGPAGRRVVAQFSPKVLSIFDADGAAPVREINLQTARRSFDFVASDDRLVTSDDDGRIQIWDTATALQIGNTFLADRSSPFAYLYDADPMFAVRSADGAVRVIDTGDGHVVRSIPSSLDVTIAQIGRDHDAIALAGASSVEIISLVSGDVIDRFGRDPGPVDFVMGSGASVAALLLHVPKGRSQLYDMGARKMLAQFDQVAHAQFTQSNPARLALATGPVLQVINPATGEKQFEADLKSSIKLMASDPAGEAVVVTTGDKRVVAYSLAEGRQIFSKGPLIRKPQSIAFGRNASRIAIYEAEGRGLTLWDVPKDAVVTQFPIEWDALASEFVANWRVAVENDRIAVVNPDSEVEIYGTNDGSRISFFTWGTIKLAGIQFLSEAQKLLAISADGQLAIWNNVKNQSDALHVLAEEMPTYGPDWHFASASGGMAAILGATGRIHLVSGTTFGVRSLNPGEKESALSGALSPDGTLLVTFPEKGKLRLWNTALGEILFEWRHPFGIKRARISANNRFLVIEEGYLDKTTILKLPEGGEALINRARALVDEGAGAAAGQPPSSPLRLGVTMLDVSEQISHDLDIGVVRGALVSEVKPASPAEAAGIRPGDVIVAVDGHAVSRGEEIAQAVKAKEPGSELLVALSRDSQIRQVRARMRE